MRKEKDLKSRIYKIIGDSELGLSLSEIVDQIGGKYSRRTVQDTLARMRSEKVITAQGKGRWTKWKKL